MKSSTSAPDLIRGIMPVGGVAARCLHGNTE